VSAPNTNGHLKRKGLFVRHDKLKHIGHYYRNLSPNLSKIRRIRNASDLYYFSDN